MNTLTLEAQYGNPTHTVLHLSDTHLVEHRRPLYGAIDSDAQLAALLDRLRNSSIRPDAIVLTGDLADHGAPDAYERLRAALDPVAAEYGCPIVWVMGNHDNRGVFREKLLDEASTDTTPIDSVTTVNGLRLIALDSTVPGHHHGEIDPEQLEWLTHELAVPAPHGTLIALHHPPVPTPLPLLQLVELRRGERLAAVIAGTDVRGILAGHFHYSTTSLLAGVPVSVAAATCYTQDLLVAAGYTRAQQGGAGANLVHVYADRVVHSSVPLELFDTVYEVTPANIAALLGQGGDAPDLMNS
ncbi:phosphodiesterase [Salinibacterium sp. GXW1014]|uniref:phosphodiesterase n=1 Tax=Salinibacterium sp. GXW1014 TaxID=3377838 RepID=UPI003839FF17